MRTFMIFVMETWRSDRSSINSVVFITDFTCYHINSVVFITDFTSYECSVSLMIYFMVD